jgi:predicted short-subunit dehydrogenase-like oxidoreductase (DUF2520 family)
MDADVYLIGTGLDAIPEVAALIPSVEGKPVIHFAGVTGTEPLSEVVERGGLACALHPVQACPDIDTAIQHLPGSAWGVTCSDGAELWASALIERDLKGLPVSLDEADRVLWHAAAVVTSNGISALLAAGERLLEEIGIENPERVLGPIAVGTSENARTAGGGARTLTGPVVRGETATVQMHVDALRDKPDDLLVMYRIVSSLVLVTAGRAGRIDRADAIAIQELLR